MKFSDIDSGNGMLEHSVSHGIALQKRSFPEHGLLLV